MLQDEGEKIGRFKVRSLMRELSLVSKQPGSHAYKKATVERPDIPNVLNRAFDVDAPNQVWCGDITYIWAQGTRSMDNPTMEASSMQLVEAQMAAHFQLIELAAWCRLSSACSARAVTPCKAFTAGVTESPRVDWVCCWTSASAA